MEGGPKHMPQPADLLLFAVIGLAQCKAVLEPVPKHDLSVADLGAQGKTEIADFLAGMSGYAVHHAEDGIHDLSCVEKLRTQLQARGYPQLAPLRLQGGARAAQSHYWLDDYNQPVLEFFSSRLR